MGNADEKIIVVESGRCSWGKCIFCSFSKKPEVPEASFERLKKILDKALTEKVGVLKYLNSGSFLDENQIPEKFRDYLVERCVALGVNELVVECLPEHITEDVLEELAKKRKGLKITFALGLEVADDEVLRKIQKSFDLKTYEKTAHVLRKFGFGVRTYLMANLPHVKNPKKSLEQSVEYALKLSDSVAVINTFPYGFSPLFKMWVGGVWHPLDKKEFEGICKKYKNNAVVEFFFDDYIAYPRFVDFMRENIVGATSACLNHPYFNVWQEYLVRFMKRRIQRNMRFSSRAHTENHTQNL